MLSNIDKMPIELAYSRIDSLSAYLKYNHIFSVEEFVEYDDVVVAYRLVEVIPAFRPMNFVLEPLCADAYPGFVSLSSMYELLCNDLPLLQLLYLLVIDHAIVYRLPFFLKLFDEGFVKPVFSDKLLWREFEDIFEYA